MAKEPENIINGLEKGRERFPGEINSAYDPMAVVIPPVCQSHRFKWRRRKILSET